MQLALVLVAIPVIRLLYGLVLVETGLGASRTTESHTCCAIRWPMSPSWPSRLWPLSRSSRNWSLCLCWHRTTKRPECPERRQHRYGCAAAGLGTIKKLVHPQGLLMIVYLILLLPLGQLGLTSILTKKVAVPPFISEELSKNPSQSLLYSGVLLVITYLNLRLIFTLPLLGTTSAGVWEAFVTSWRLTRWRSLRFSACSCCHLRCGTSRLRSWRGHVAPTIALTSGLPHHHGWPPWDSVSFRSASS